MSTDQDKMSASEKKKEDWMNTKWRPMMGWMYMLVCTCDFVLFPVLWSLVQAMHGGRVETQWSPITLNGAGLFHMAMGAILGIAAFGRTQEKLAGANNNNSSQFNNHSQGYPNSSPMSNYSNPSPMSNYPRSSPMSNYPSSSPSPAPVFVSSSGKAGPAPQQDPVL